MHADSAELSAATIRDMPGRTTPGNLSRHRPAACWSSTC